LGQGRKKLSFITRRPHPLERCSFYG
jgi:hypothetical protein